MINAATKKNAALEIQKANTQLASILSVAAQTASSVDSSQTAAQSSTAVFDALATTINTGTAPDNP